MKEQNVFRSTNPNAPGLVIATGGMPDLGGVQQQIDQLRNQVGAQADYTQPGNPLAAVCAEYTTATAQVFANNTAAACNYSTRVRDTHNAVTVGAAWKFTAPFSRTYSINAAAMFAATTAWGLGEIAAMLLYLDGVWLCNLDRFDGPDVAGVYRFVSLFGNTTLWLNRGQTASIYLLQVSGGDLALYNTALVNWVRIAG